MLFFFVFFFSFFLFSELGKTFWGRMQTRGDWRIPLDYVKNVTHSVSHVCNRLYTSNIDIRLKFSLTFPVYKFKNENDGGLIFCRSKAEKPYILPVSKDLYDAREWPIVPCDSGESGRVVHANCYILIIVIMIMIIHSTYIAQCPQHNVAQSAVHKKCLHVYTVQDKPTVYLHHTRHLRSFRNFTNFGFHLATQGWLGVKHQLSLPT